MFSRLTFAEATAASVFKQSIELTELLKQLFGFNINNSFLFIRKLQQPTQKSLYFNVIQTNAILVLTVKIGENPIPMSWIIWWLRI